MLAIFNDLSSLSRISLAGALTTVVSPSSGVGIYRDRPGEGLSFRMLLILLSGLVYG
jgi:hypothetical protein